MWYFYRKYDNEDLDNLIEQINGIFCSIFVQKEYEYPAWMEEVKLKGDFEAFKQAYELSTGEEKRKLSSTFELNIQIESICSMEVEPVSYEELLLSASDEFCGCLDKLKSIQTYLYENLLKLKGMQETVGTLKNYYEKFYSEAIEFVCPFCGLDNMLTKKDEFREAFDHYLPRSKYPFVSFLRENLFPICHTCNSTYKGDKNPRDFGKAFYPFTTESNDCELVFKVRAGVIEDMEISSEKFLEEIETWNALFGIKNRITNFAEVNLNGWMSNVQEAMKNYNVDYDHARNAEISGCNPKMQDHKFVKKAILKAL
ncbi:hypothetical protein AB9M92_07465 [Peribacillus frigoritolerans]|uniref:hypothetical protein n=1 Tax=Peribacillus frigoritolerans TaxID=450367 RepID=UPI0035124264